MYQIETTDGRGNWTTEGIGEDDANEFATRAEAEAMIARLRALGPEWAEADYRVVEAA